MSTHFIFLPAIALHFEKQVTGIGNTKKTLYGSGIRSALGSVNLNQTSLDMCGPGKYTYVPYRNYKPMQNNECSLFNTVELNFDILTRSQRTAEWFMLRCFSISSTVAYVVLHSIARFLIHEHCDEDKVIINRTLQFVGINNTDEGNDHLIADTV